MDTTKLKTRLEDKVKDLGGQSEAASVSDLAPALETSNYIALTSNTLSIIRENLKNQPLSLDLFDIVKSPSGGATVFSVPGLAGDGDARRRAVAHGNLDRGADGRIAPPAGAGGTPAGGAASAGGGGTAPLCRASCQTGRGIYFRRGPCGPGAGVAPGPA